MSIKRKRKFRHLTQKDRDKIDVLIREGYTLEKIAKKLVFMKAPYPGNYNATCLRSIKDILLQLLKQRQLIVNLFVSRNQNLIIP